MVIFFRESLMQGLLFLRSPVPAQEEMLIKAIFGGHTFVIADQATRSRLRFEMKRVLRELLTMRQADVLKAYLCLDQAMIMSMCRKYRWHRKAIKREANKALDRIREFGKVKERFKNMVLSAN
jgi:hypothetical protein